MTNFLAKPIQDIGHQDLARVETALQLYTSDLLDEFHEDWALRERENMRLLFLKGMAHLMNYYTHQNLFEQSIACGQQILNIDPLREEIHRELMRIYSTSGQRPLAVHQYKICREVLMAELGIEPMQETQNLYDLVLVSSGTNPEQHGKEKSPTFYQILRQFNEAITALNHAQAQFKQAIKMLEKL
jgi:two-component SAPR family response regulator